MSRKPVTRVRPASQIDGLMNVYARIEKREPLGPDDLRFLRRLLHALAIGVDVRSWFYTPVEGAPASDHRFFVALNVLLTGDHKDKAIRGQVGDAWGLTDRAVRDAVRDHADDARAMIGDTSDREALLRVVAWHRERWKATRRVIRH